MTEIFIIIGLICLAAACWLFRETSGPFGEVNRYGERKNKKKRWQWKTYI